jgi:hypothetical protein
MTTIIKNRFPNGLPSLAELAKLNADKSVPAETAWIWGEQDEVRSVSR